MQTHTILHRRLIEALLNKDFVWVRAARNHKALHANPAPRPAPTASSAWGLRAGGMGESEYSLKCSQSCSGFIY